MSGESEERAEPIAVVGMACRYPDAEAPEQLWEIALEGRRTFRRLPKERLDPDDYWDRDPAAADRTYSAYAAVLDGWEFDRARFRVPASVYRAADPAHWLALETADKALADAGRPGGAGLVRDRVGVLVGNTLTGEVTRARTLRLRWPYVRRVLASAMAAEGLSDERLRAVLDRAAERYLAPFPEVDDETLAGSLSNTIAGRICNHFDFGGGGYTVDGACASSLLALITACRALRDRSVDFALAGGVDLSLDPFELVGFAKTGALAAGRMRVYDERSAGFWPGEGCGMVALMRAADARSAGFSVRAEIAGWGVSSDGSGGITRPERTGQLLALRRAYASGGLDPARVLLHEGHGTGTAVGDETELAALAELRGEATRPAVLGSIKANIGHTKAAAGAASLIKTVCSLESGLLPPTTGCERPHPALRAAAEVLTAADRPRAWPDGTRLAGVSAMGFGGINTHVVLRGTADARRDTVEVRGPAPRVDVVPLEGRDVGELHAMLGRLAELAPRLSEAQLGDVACRFGQQGAGHGPRVALVAASPEELAARAEAASALLATLPDSGLVARDGVYAAGRVRGNVCLLFPGQGAPVRAQGEGTEAVQPAIHRESLVALRWLQRLGARAFAAIGHSLGEFAALVWAGCLSEQDAERLVRERGRLMEGAGTTGTGMLSVTADARQALALCEGSALVIAAFNGPHSHVLAGPLPDLRAAAERARTTGLHTALLPVSHAFHSPAVAGCVPEFRTLLSEAGFHPPERHVVSTVSGQPISASDDLVELLCRQITEPVRFACAFDEIAEDIDLFCEVGPGRTLGALVAQASAVPVVGVDQHGDARTRAEAAAALFAAKAVPDLTPLFAERAARPIDIWRDPVFLANPCSTAPGTPHRESLAPVPEEPHPVVAAGPAEVVCELVATMTELDPTLITPELRLLGDLHLTSLRVVQLVAAAAEAAGRGRPEAPLSVADATVADLIDVVEQLPTAKAASAEYAPQGVAPWLRCFTETLRPIDPSIPSGPSTTERGSHRAYIVRGHPLSGRVADVFGSGLRYPLLYVPDPAATDVPAVVLAAVKAAVDAGGLVAVAHDAALRGFLRTLRHEHPALGITLLRVPSTEEDLRAAHPYATVIPGVWRERVLTDGEAGEPAENPLDLDQQGDGYFLGQDDVLLVSGGKGIGVACAVALARASGVRLAMLGRSDPADDAALRDNLHRLHEDGINAAYHRADVTDPKAVAEAVGWLREQLGPITGVLHSSGINEPAGVDQLDENRLRAHLAPKITGLSNLLATVATERLRTLVTFGSVIGTWGLPGESHYALANGVLRAEMQRLRDALPDCRVLNIDWSVWAGTGMGERLGVLDTLAQLDVTAIPLAEGTDMFLRLLAANDLPASVAVHGRLGGMDGSAEVEAAETEAGAGRFLERVRIHHPGVELIADATLGLSRDEYLNGHRIDGIVVLPAVLGLEAMAQAVNRLVGHPVREVADLVLDRPIVVPDEGSRIIRICALRRGDIVDVVVRSDETGFRAEHLRASFLVAANPEPVPPEPQAADTGSVVDGEDLYGPVYFHTGRFRRVRELVAHGARRCQIRVLAKEDDPWFDTAPLLGSPAVNDAAVHALQACVPHRRLLPVRCERMSFAPAAETELHLCAAERSASGGEYIWDVVAYGAGGAAVITWHGLTLADAGPLPPTDAWPLPLLAVHVERTVTTIGLDKALRVSILPDSAETNATLADARSVARAAGVVLTVAGGERSACAARTVASRSHDEWCRLLGERVDAVEEMQAQCPESYDSRASRIRTAVECLSSADSGPLLLEGVYDGGWVVLRCGSARIATVVVPVADGATPLAIAILSGPREDRR
ncbi:type I polyketide synthase [Amycolatopsis palatopharyngis]|uniref:type I polyketide synthase n=1 Tax=Amycolatopsis palatopharyngis TaxID=187982 RepID=UPI000E24F3F4|nr:type I polyketide synthase [Amycolatopsis palatopharyngis]